MPRRSGWEPFPPYGKPVPVADGIRARSTRGAIAQTWWSQRFLDLLESFGMGPRLARGKTYARKGQVISMDIEPGGVSAMVQGSRARPYRVRIGVAELTEADWAHAEAELAGRAIFLAKLLAGEMPPDVEDAFAACELTLFPARPADLDTTCSCPDWANPCKHIAAVYYLLAEAFDDDPFLIFTWRGRERAALLERLRALRGGARPAAGDGDAVQPEADRDDGWPTVEAPPLGEEGFWQPAAPLEEPHGAPRRAVLPDALLRQLAPAEIRVGGRPLDEVLAPLYADLTAAAAERLDGA